MTMIQLADPASARRRPNVLAEALNASTCAGDLPTARKILADLCDDVALTVNVLLLAGYWVADQKSPNLAARAQSQIDQACRDRIDGYTHSNRYRTRSPTTLRRSNGS